jgi:hypothetical protein
MTPVLMAVSDDELLARLELELGKRYGADYEIVCEASADTADAAIVRLSEEGRGVAVVLADQSISGVSGPGFWRGWVSCIRRRSGVVDPVGEWSAAEALGQVEFWTWRERRRACHARVRAGVAVR